jgi:ABC-type branched-subunit amino acid transport system substrate-binding protein
MSTINGSQNPSPTGPVNLPVWVKVLGAFLAGAVLVAASLVHVVPNSLGQGRRGGVLGLPGAGSDEELLPEGYALDEEGNLVYVGDEGAGGAEGSEGTAGGQSGAGGAGLGGAAGGSSTGGPGGGACNAAGNGGATDKGVSSTKINLATTAALDGPAASLLKDSVTGMKAVMERVNREGGVCGRRLELRVDNDGFDAQRGSTYIRNYIESGQYFALPVVPSAEGLGSAIRSGVISSGGMPVVGTDGLRQEQYGEAWVWPVATATVSTMRIMAKYGRQTKKASTFAIVWDNKYKFGLEGKAAFVDQVGDLGGTVVHDQPLNPDQPSYAGEAQTFNEKCGGGKCDMVALLLLPDTAKKWMTRNPALGRLYTAGAQTLFTDKFGRDCVQAAGDRCHGIAAWTGYNPPIGGLASKSGVAKYVNEVRALNPAIDVRNQFLQGAYLGMSVFVEALRKTGPNLTRAGLRTTLDSLQYPNDLSATLTWSAGNHWANVQSQAFSMVVTQGTFNGWSHTSGFISDPGR